MHERLLKFICCPDCRGSLQLDEQVMNGNEIISGRLVCGNCRSIYSISGGVPLMLTKAAWQSWNKSQIKTLPLKGFKVGLSRLLKMTLPPDAYSVAASQERINKFLSGINGENILNLGSGKQNLGAKVISVDINKEEGISLVADAHQLPFFAASFDAVVCTAVLEHVWNPDQVVAEIYRILKKNGKVYLELPFIYAYHPASSTEMDYIRYTEPGIKRLFNKFTAVKLDVGGGPAVGLISIIRKYLAELLNCWHSFNAPRELTDNLLGWLLLPLVWLDPLVHRKKDLASVFYYIGVKSNRGDE